MGLESRKLVLFAQVDHVKISTVIPCSQQAWVIGNSDWSKKDFSCFQFLNSFFRLRIVELDMAELSTSHNVLPDEGDFPGAHYGHIYGYWLL